MSEVEKTFSKNPLTSVHYLYSSQFPAIPTLCLCCATTKFYEHFAEKKADFRKIQQDTSNDLHIIWKTH